jgi:cell division septal protein FtsQ
MWYDDPFVKFKKRKRNRRRRGSRDPILMVNARVLAQRRHRIHRFGAVALFAAAIAGLLWLSLLSGRWAIGALFTTNPRYTITQFDLSSDGKRIPPRLIREFGGLEEGMNLFAVNLPDIRRRLEEVPLVQQAQAQRVMPSTLKVWVTERVAISRLGPENTPYPLAIDRYGYVLGRSARHPGLPQITGVDMSQLRPGKQTQLPEITDALRVLDLCDTEPALAKVLHINRIDVSDINFLQLYLDPQRTAQLTREKLDTSLRNFAAQVQTADEFETGWTNFNNSVIQNPTVQ